MAKSKEELIYDIENELVDPTTNKITGERVKARLFDMVDAMGEGGGAANEYWKAPDTIEASVRNFIAGLAPSVKCDNGTGTISFGPGVVLAFNEGIIVKGLIWCPHFKFTNAATGELVSYEQSIQMEFNITDWSDLGFTRIGEEEYYTV